VTRIRVLQFADQVNRHDFIDNIIRYADPESFEMGVCVRTAESVIAAPAYPQGTPEWVIGAVSRWQLPLAVARLARIIRRWKPDIVHAHHYDEALIASIAIRMRRGTRLVLGRHYSNTVYRSTSGLKRRVYLAVENHVNRVAARIIAPSRFIREILVDWQRVPADKVDCIAYGFAAEKYAAVPAAEVAELRRALDLEGRFVLGNFARLHEEKGQRFLIDAIRMLHARHPNLALLIVGEGAERPRLETQIQSLGLADTVHLLGRRRDAMAVMAAVDAVVQPSLQEAFSQVMAEAMWMAKPLIMSDVSGAVDIIRHEHNGLLVPQGDAGALAAAIERLVDDPSFARRLGQEGKKYVEQHLAMPAIIGRYEEVYRKAREGHHERV
jgi:glycosyltransferase involved in cell wall biosynthesis